MRAGSRAALFLATLAMLALSLGASTAASQHPEAALGGGAPWQGALQGIAAVAAVAAGLTLMLHRRVVGCGLLLALTGPAIAVAQLPVADLGSSVFFTAALTFGAAAPALVACVAANSPLIPLLRLDRAIVVITLATAVIVQGVLITAVYDPGEAGCFGCAANLGVVRADPALHSQLGQWGLLLTVVWGGVVPARVYWRWRAAGRTVRQAWALPVVGGCGVAALAAFAAAHELLAATPELDSTLHWLWLGQCGLVVAIAVGVALEGRRARRSAAAMTTAVMTSSPRAQGLRTSFAATIDDPTLELLFLRDNGAAINADDREDRAGGASTAAMRVARGQHAIAEVRYDPRLVGAAFRLLSVVRAAGLAVEHLAAHAGLQAELTDLAAARGRIIAAGDAERRRLERDLHDGAQQQLIALQVHLQLAAATAPPAAAVLYQAARTEVGIALEELRELAHGIHPAALTEGGLGTGLLTLAETSPVPLVVAGPREARHPAAAEAAAYRLVADALHIAGEAASGPTVTVTLHDDTAALRVQLTVDGLDPTAGEGIISRALDRVAALEGSVLLAAATGHITIDVVIPCAS